MSLFTPKLRRALIVFLFALPLLSGVLGKIMKSNAWFGDYRAVACGAQKLIEGGALYDMNLSCDGMGKAAVYVYLPVVAEVSAAFIGVLGEDGFFYLYAALYILSLAVLFWGIYLHPPLQALGRSGGAGLMLKRQDGGGILAEVTPPSRTSRATSPANAGEDVKFMQIIPFAAFLTGSAVVWGNIAVLCHAGVLGASLMAKRWPWLFVAVVALCGVIKPVFLTYLMVVLCLDFQPLKRLSLFVAGALAGVLPTVLFAFDGSALSQQWHDILAYFVYSLTPGESFYGWLSLIGIRADHPAASFGWLGFAGLMSLSGIAIAEGLNLSPRARIWLGLSLGVLMIPRLMSQDVFLIGIGLVMIALYSPTLSATSKPLTFLKARGLTVLTAICVFCLIGNAVELGDYTTKIATLLLSLYVLTLGGLTFAQRRPEIIAALFPRKVT